MTKLEFMRRLMSARGIARRVSPDFWNNLCLSKGLDVRRAQNRYKILQDFDKGIAGICYYNQNVSDDVLEDVLLLAEEAEKILLASEEKIHEIKGLPYCGKSIIVYWREGSKETLDLEEEILSKELLLAEPKTYRFISELMDNGNTIIAIIQQCDTIYNANEYFGQRRDGKEPGSDLKVFEGDVFCVFSKEFMNYWDHPEDCGMYVAYVDGYRRLVYTPGKGYIRRLNPDFDVDFDAIHYSEKDLFNHNIMRHGRNFCWVGNIYVDIEFLKENGHGDSH